MMNALRLGILKTTLVLGLSGTFGLQATLAVVAVEAPAAESGYDVGLYCVGEARIFDTCIRGGCKALHVGDDKAGYDECLRKARLIPHKTTDRIDETPETPDPADPAA